MKKNILGMNMTEWKHLSGLADPYKLALAEAGVQAGVPIVEARGALANLPDGPDHDDDDPVISTPKTDVKKERRPHLVNRLRALTAKTRNAADKTAGMPASERHGAYLAAMKAKKAKGAVESVEDFDIELVWAGFLESRGTNADEFGQLLDIAIESDDEDMAIELIAIEDQLDELLGAKPAAPKAPVAAAAAAGKQQATGAMAAAVKPPVMAPAPAAGGGAPAGATPPAGAPPAAPAGAVAPAAPAMPAAAAVPAAAPAGGTKKIGLLGTMGRAAPGQQKLPPTKPAAAPVAAPPGPVAGAPAPGVALKPKKEDADADEWEEFIAEEFGMSGEQYVDAFDRAIEEDDQDVLGNAHQIDEIFAAWRAKKAEAASAKKAKIDAGYQAARDVIKAKGQNAVDAANSKGKSVDAPSVPKKGTGTTLNTSLETSDIADQIMESSGYMPRAKPSDLKALISCQLQYSGYTDEYIENQTNGFDPNKRISGLAQSDKDKIDALIKQKQALKQAAGQKR